MFWSQRCVQDASWWECVSFSLLGSASLKRTRKPFTQSNCSVLAFFHALWISDVSDFLPSRPSSQTTFVQLQIPSLLNKQRYLSWSLRPPKMVHGISGLRARHAKEGRKCLPSVQPSWRGIVIFKKDSMILF